MAKMETSRDPIPQPKSRLFRAGKGRKYFTTNACLNYMDSSFPYRFGYREAADILIAHVEETGTHQDALVFPIIFLFRHHLELFLKAIIVTMRHVLDLQTPTSSELMTHDLRQLWNWAKPLIAELGENSPYFRDCVRDGNRVFAEFQRFDKKAETFRFARSRSGQPHLPEFRVINIRIFRDECDQIAGFLEGVLEAAEQAWEYVAERKAEMQADLR